MLRLLDTSERPPSLPGYTFDDRISTPVIRPRGWYARLRLIMEFGAVLILSVISAPIIALAALLVRLTSSGPAFYTQTRLGLNGREYTIFKLRSMYAQSELLSGPCWSSNGDPRVTPLGRILRRTHIDELPQLWNILRGDMSLIGPRPERPEFLARLEKAIPRYRERLRVRPGVTGFAQVQLPPDVDIFDVRRKQAYDLYYIASMDPWLDLRILLCTPFKMCGVSYPTLRMLFAMPSPAKVESDYFQAVNVGTGEPVTQVQLA